MAGTFRRALVIGAVILGAATACGQAIDHASETAARLSSSPGNGVASNKTASGGAVFDINAEGTSTVGGQLTALQHRTAGDVQLRLFTSSNANGETCTPESTQCVPPWCTPTGQLVAEVSNDAMADVEVGTIIGLAPGSQVSVLNTSMVGTAEHSPVHLVMVKVASDVAQVRFTTPDGTDSAAPVSGLAVLAVPSSSSANGTITLLAENGGVFSSLRLPQENPLNTSACAPQPLPLPKAGQQPADPAGAEKAVRAAYAKAFTAVPNDESYSSLSAVQDGDRLHGTLDQLRHNFAQAAASSAVDTGRLVFTNPQTAVLKFTLQYTGGVPYGTHNGTAVLENGMWFVSRDTYCGVMEFGAAPCPPA